MPVIDIQLKTKEAMLPSRGRKDTDMHTETASNGPNKNKGDVC